MADELNGPLGSTGKFPNGMASPDDSGQLRMAIYRRGDLVVMQFGTYIDWFANNAAGTRNLANKMLKLCDEIEGKS